MIRKELASMGLAPSPPRGQVTTFILKHPKIKRIETFKIGCTKRNL